MILRRGALCGITLPGASAHPAIWDPCSTLEHCPQRRTLPDYGWFPVSGTFLWMTPASSDSGSVSNPIPGRCQKAMK